MKILGISCFYHDSAAAAIENGKIAFAIQEERLSRRKHDNRFPIMSIMRAMETLRWRTGEIDAIAFYEDPGLKLRRIYSQVLLGWPRSRTLFMEHLPKFYRFKLPVDRVIRDALGYKGKIIHFTHHYSHAASSFFTSPFKEALVLTVDGVGEYDTTAVFHGKGNDLKKVCSMRFPDSLGLFYSVFTDYLGFEVNEGEYKVMGLAPYGEPAYLDRILGKVITLYPDGSFRLNRRYFTFHDPARHYSDELVSALGVPPRKKDGPMSKEHCDLAASVQKALELALVNMLKPLLARIPVRNLCLAGGVALNCTANSEIIRTLGVNLHIQPAAGDAGGALGCALAAYARERDMLYRAAFSPYLGTSHSTGAIDAALSLNGIASRRCADTPKEVAARLAGGKIVAVLQGRDEWGPRALGNRSILADPRSPGMKDHLNAKIKFREEFRPFAPVVMAEHYGEYFETLGMRGSPYMLFTHKAKQPQKIPAAVHNDNSSRVQSVNRGQNPYLYAILEEFYRLTGVPVLINTSFNLRGEPIVSSPSDALKTFYASGIDCLAIEDFLVEKTPLETPERKEYDHANT